MSARSENKTIRALAFALTWTWGSMTGARARSIKFLAIVDYAMRSESVSSYIIAFFFFILVAAFRKVRMQNGSLSSQVL